MHWPEPVPIVCDDNWRLATIIGWRLLARRAEHVGLLWEYAELTRSGGGARAVKIEYHSEDGASEP